MYATIYGNIIDAKSTEVDKYQTLLNKIPDEVIRDDWENRYKLIREKFPRNYLTSKIHRCATCDVPLNARQARAHKCPKNQLSVK